MMDKKIAFQSPEERLENWRKRARKSLERLATLNEMDGAIDTTCVELAALHNAFAHKHSVMRQMRAGRLDLDCYDQRGEDTKCTG